MKLSGKVTPGFTLTPNYDQDSRMIKSFMEGTLIKRWIQVEEIAEAVTGENLVIDGGFTISQLYIDSSLLR